MLDWPARKAALEPDAIGPRPHGVDSVDIPELFTCICSRDSRIRGAPMPEHEMKDKADTIRMTTVGVGIVQTEVPIPGLTPELVDPTTQSVIRQSNLDDKLVAILEAIRVRPWIKQLWRDVLKRDRSAIITTVIGGLVITTAIGAEYEFGIRHGKDIKEFSKHLKLMRRLQRT